MVSLEKGSHSAITNKSVLTESRMEQEEHISRRYYVGRNYFMYALSSNILISNSVSDTSETLTKIFCQPF